MRRTSVKHKSICFVMMPFAEPFNPVFDESIRPAIAASDLHCVRADDIPDPGVVADQIGKEIDGSLVCVADLTNLNRNVVYEVALAHARGKPVILITQDSPETLPFDLRHFRVIKYDSTLEGRRALCERLSLSLSAAVGAPDSPTRYLEEMLVPRSLGSRDGAFVIAASPRSWREASRLAGGFTKLRRTCSDHIGIRGLIQAFGLIFGLDRLPDLLDPGDYADQVLRESPANLYCIGSPKANRWSGLLLEDFYKCWHPRFEFKADPRSKDLRNIRVMLQMNGSAYRPHNLGLKDVNPFVRDFGILVRGPHPADPNSVFMVMAGRSSLGTEAVCRAATDPTHIAEIRRRLQNERVDLSNHKQAFWVVATMDRDMTEEGSYEAILPSFEISEVHAFRRDSPK
jgi:hypothetical protein